MGRRVGLQRRGLAERVEPTCWALGKPPPEGVKKGVKKEVKQGEVVEERARLVQADEHEA